MPLQSSQPEGIDAIEPDHIKITPAGIIERTKAVVAIVVLFVPNACVVPVAPLATVVVTVPTDRLAFVPETPLIVPPVIATLLAF